MRQTQKQKLETAKHEWKKDIRQLMPNFQFLNLFFLSIIVHFYFTDD